VAKKKAKKNSKKKTKKKTKKKDKKKKATGYKKVGESYVSDGSSYKSMFKKAKGKLKIIELKISKKKTIKVKLKYSKKKKVITLLNPIALETGRGAGIIHIQDSISLFRHLWDIVRFFKSQKIVTSKKKDKLEKLLQLYQTEFLSYKNY